MNGLLRLSLWWTRHRFAVVVAAAGAFFAVEALARPGGGQSYSGGGFSGGSRGGFSSGSSSSGSGDGGILIWLLFRLVVLAFQHPVVGVPLLVIAVVLTYFAKKTVSPSSGWSSGGSTNRSDVADRFGAFLQSNLTPQINQALAQAGVAPAGAPTAALDAIAQQDPNFSRPLFEDFLYTLFAKAHEARGDGKLDLLAPYITEPARRVLGGLGPVQDVRGVIVGAMNIVSVQGAGPPQGQTTVTTRFEANYTEVDAGGRTQNYYVVEQWTLRRQNNVTTKSPDEVSIHQCPACGAAQEQSGHGVCQYCGQRVDTGEYDWVVTDVIQLEKSGRQPQLTGTVPERGTNLPTIKDPAATTKLDALKARDPQFDYLQFQDRVRLIYGALNQAWVGKRWEKARPFLTNELFQSQRYWIEEYQKQRLTNHMDDAQLGRLDLCKVSSDRFYDAITLRVYARAKDYTTSDDTGKVVGGDAHLARAYSEYWTLIRRAGVKKATTTEANCPSCGAALEVNMAGECAYCGSTITKGDFDWVLSRIEQDESYRG